MTTKSISTISRRRVLQGGLGAAALAFMGAPREVLAQGAGPELYAIITNFGVTATNPNAHFDISVDSRFAPLGTDILFNVFNANGAPLAEFATQTNANGFTSSALAPAPNRNLFRVSNGEPALVRARTPAAATSTTGILLQRGQDTRLVIGVSPTVRADNTPLSAGKLFPIPVGDRAAREIVSASLLIGNVSGADAQVDVFVGTKGPDGSGIATTPRLPNFGVWRVDLTTAMEPAHLVVSSTGNIIVQMVINDGRLNGVSCLPA